MLQLREPSSLRKQHTRTFRVLEAEARKNGTKSVRKVVFYAFRHTFLTRLAESGCDAWTLSRIAEHSTVPMSSRFMHPSNEAVSQAMLRLGGHDSVHHDYQPQIGQHESKLLTD